MAMGIIIHLEYNVYIFEFPEEYVQNNIIQAYVRTVFASMAIYEEWEDKDFWNHMT